MTTLSNPHPVTCNCSYCVARRIQQIVEDDLEKPKPAQQYKRSSDPRYWKRRDQK